jgi:glycosyltransferase involved in cell wall biosynthesis
VPLIGLVARYHPMKDHENFLLAASCLAAVRPDVCFVLAGYGVDAGNVDLLALIDALGLRHRVFLLGEVAEVATLTSGFDVACSSSWSEAFPNAVGEAMSCGVPCVVTDVGDSAEIVGDTGWIVPPRDPEALAVAWNKALSIGSETRRALGARARARVLERYGMTAVVGHYEALYLSAMEKS